VLLHSPLHLLLHVRTQRTPLDASLVRCDDALLLVDEKERDVIVWIGQDSSVFAASMAKQVSLYVEV
jgi:hypothetical protein